MELVLKVGHPKVVATPSGSPSSFRTPFTLHPEVVVSGQGMMSQNAADGGLFANYLVEIGPGIARDLATGLLGSWLYDRFKATKTRLVSKNGEEIPVEDRKRIEAEIDAEIRRQLGR